MVFDCDCSAYRPISANVEFLNTHRDRDEHRRMKETHTHTHWMISWGFGLTGQWALEETWVRLMCVSVLQVGWWGEAGLRWRGRVYGEESLRRGIKNNVWQSTGRNELALEVHRDQTRNLCVHCTTAVPLYETALLLKLSQALPCWPG